MGDVRFGSGVRLLMTGRGFGGLPIPGSDLGWPPMDGSDLGGLPIKGSGCFCPMPGSGRRGPGRVGLVVSPSAPSPSCDGCGTPFLGRAFPPAGAFPFPRSGRCIGARCSGLSGMCVGPNRLAPPKGGKRAGRSGMAAPVGPNVSWSVAKALRAWRETSPPLTGGSTERRSSRFGVSWCEGMFVRGGRPCTQRKERK